MKQITSGNWKKYWEAEKGSEQHKDELTIHNGIIFRGVVPFIPPKLWHLVLAKAHETHPGKNATEASVRMIAWWPGITQDVQHFVSKSKKFKLNRPSQRKTVSAWPEADVWERLHMDSGNVKDQGNILIIVDAGSGWIEAFPAGNRTSETVKVYLSQLFARSGIQKILISDNGPEFVSGDLKQWSESLGIKKMESPIYHPRAKGLAERAVQTVKRALQAWSPNLNVSIGAFLQRSLKGEEQNSSWTPVGTRSETTSNSRFRHMGTHSIQGQWRDKGSSCCLHHQEGLEHIFHTARKLDTDYSSERQPNCKTKEDNVKTEPAVEETISQKEQ